MMSYIKRTLAALAIIAGVSAPAHAQLITEIEVRDGNGDLQTVPTLQAVVDVMGDLLTGLVTDFGEAAPTQGNLGGMVEDGTGDFVPMTSPDGQSLRVSLDGETLTVSTGSTMGANVPNNGFYVGFRDQSGNMAPAILDASGNLPIAGGPVTTTPTNTLGAAIGTKATPMGVENESGNLELPKLNASDEILVNDASLAAAVTAGTVGVGTAGTPSADVLSVQGVSGGDPVDVDCSTCGGTGTFAAAMPTTGVALGAKDSANLVALEGTAANGLEVDITRNSALVAGNANIGDVDVASIAAGDNNIGNVDIASFTGILAVVPQAIVATCATTTRPANTTPYSIGDAVSNNGTAGSVTATSCTVSDTNDEPVTIERIRVASTDTGANNKQFRLWLYRSDPTASSGVVGGDNAAYSTKQGTFLGTFSGLLRAFSDGSVGVLAPDEGQRAITLPTSGGQTVYYFLQTLEAFTPSANSTTFIPTIEGVQAR